MELFVENIKKLPINTIREKLKISQLSAIHFKKTGHVNVDINILMELLVRSIKQS